ncbi:hypothetical protein ACLOJK_034297 [Asimina triloba]
MYGAPPSPQGNRPWRPANPLPAADHSSHEIRQPLILTGSAPSSPAPSRRQVTYSDPFPLYSNHGRRQLEQQRARQQCNGFIFLTSDGEQHLASRGWSSEQQQQRTARHASGGDVQQAAVGRPTSSDPVTEKPSDPSSMADHETHAPSPNLNRPQHNPSSQPPHVNAPSSTRQ